jgi:hypothetical protein
VAPREGAVRRARFDLRPGTGVAFWGGATGGFVSFATSGALGALGAVVLHDQLGVTSSLVWGASIGLVHAASALAQIAAASWSSGQLFAVGGGLLAGGLAVMVSALADPTVWLWLAGCTVMGAACGLLFKAALVTSTLTAQPSGRAGVLAVFFTTAYLGMASGGIVFALLREWTTPTSALAWLSTGLCAVALAGGLAAARRPVRP